MTPAVEIRDVRKNFRVAAGPFRRRLLHAVNGVSLTIAGGEVLGLVGESGCGKTTVGRILLGLEHPTSGEVLLHGTSRIELDRLTAAQRIQAIFQDPYSSLNPRRTIGAIIASPLTFRREATRHERQMRAEEMMERVGLPRRLSMHYPNQLSGGQRQRVAIARALIIRPSIVVCDEPTSALDVSVQAQILNLLQQLQMEFRLTLLLISHNLAVVEHMASRVAVMYLGRIVEEGETRVVFADPAHPYTRALLGSVLSLEPGRELPDTQLGTAFPDPMHLPPGCAFHPRCPVAVGRCKAETPALLAIASGRLLACHLATESRPASLRKGGAGAAIAPRPDAETTTLSPLSNPVMCAQASEAG